MVLNSLVDMISNVSSNDHLSILTYHRVGESYNQLFMDERLFEQQLIWLKRYFNPISLSEGLMLQKEGLLPKRSVVITVDDGYSDSFTTIYPILKKHKLTATFFISTSGLKKGYLWDELISSALLQLPITIEQLTFEGTSYTFTTHNERLECLKIIVNKIKYSSLTEREHLITHLLEQTGQPSLSHQFLSEEQIQILHKEGMEIGAHTINHPILLCENDNVAKHEILTSKLQLEKIIGAPVNFLAYPNGKKDKDFNAVHERIAENCGFKAAFSTDLPTSSLESNNIFCMNRFTPWDTSESKFILRLALHSNQHFMRLVN